MARLNMRQSATPIDRASMDAETNDPSRELIHNHQDPVGPQGYRLTAEQIHTPEAFFHVAEESQPGRPARAVSRPVVMERILRTTSLSIARLKAKVICSAIRGQPQRGLRCFISTIAWTSFRTRSLRAGLAIVIGGEQHAVFLLAHRLVKAQQG